MKPLTRTESFLRDRGLPYLSFDSCLRKKVAIGSTKRVEPLFTLDNLPSPFPLEIIHVQIIGDMPLFPCLMLRITEFAANGGWSAWCKSQSGIVWLGMWRKEGKRIYPFIANGILQMNTEKTDFFDYELAHDWRLGENALPLAWGKKRGDGEALRILDPYLFVTE